MTRAVQIADRWHRRTPPADDVESCKKCGTRDYPYASADHGTEHRWAVRWRDPEGKQRKRLFRTKPEAQKYAGELKSSMDGGTYINPATPRTTFREVALKWQTASGIQHRPATVANVDRSLKRHILPTFGDRAIGTIRKADVQDWVTERAAVLAPSTLEVVYGTLRAVFAWAVGEYIPVSPCDSRGRADRVRLPSRTAKEVVPLSAAQVSALTDAAPDRYRAAILLTAASGLRQGELFGLEPRHIRDGEIVVRQQVSVIDGKGVHVAPVKTSSSRRVVPVPQAVTDAVRAHLDAFPVAPQLMADTTDGNRRERKVRLVFTTVAGEPVQRSPWARVWRKMMGGANKILADRGEEQIPAGTTLHTLRHTYASLLIKHGESVKVVQKRLGHASAAVTLDVYGHLWPDSDESTRAAVALGLGALIKAQSRAHTNGNPPESTEDNGNEVSDHSG
ncbi:tyrosine-type recombinase/integrase [Streptomyces sp. NPDC059783]|uniref:tyrosine-type recombinase/integrase n=1 Tax=Streptomyces sp. NPDC059783 TaxID=3346944 RepID=UPI003659632A